MTAMFTARTVAAAVYSIARLPDRRARVVARVLAARHLVQAWVIDRDPTPTKQWVGVGVDAVHGASMTMFAVADPQWRQFARTEAAIALLFAAGGCRAAVKDDAARSL